ncbi:ATP synthase-coupling factor 6, mitochondrial-like [Stegodyphus dumicola]|uniref:ATP synthase-coupling factor 6, mitochondrial-like n=1 Tax=Stegodyphus dumicola TaxID=202533 RepID=UPI0015B13D7C|nr:ATP synthase-coupling factor 6, mitochondrial-like [Stegodyphus dumicola]
MSTSKLLVAAQRTFKNSTLPYRNFGFCAVLMAKTPTDPIQKLFLEKLKEYGKLSSTQGSKLVDISPEKQKEYDEGLNNLKKQYGADKDDFSKFPTFSFPEPKLDPINLEERNEENI